MGKILRRAKEPRTSDFGVAGLFCGLADIFAGHKQEKEVTEQLTKLVTPKVIYNFDNQELSVATTKAEAVHKLQQSREASPETKGVHR